MMKWKALEHHAEPWSVTTLRRLVGSPQGKIGLLVLGAFLLIAAFAPVIAPYDPLFQFNGHELEGPSVAHVMGTDDLGRDVLSRIIYGARIALRVGVSAVAIASVVGASSGLVAGYFGGWTDAVIMRVWDAALAFPGILTGVAIVTLFGPGTGSSALAVGIITMPGFARLAAAAMAGERHKDYVTAAESLGVPARRIIYRHILPNTLAPLLVHAALAFAGAIFFEAALSFLGLGSQPPTPSWGSMLSESRQFVQSAPYFVIFPGATIAVLLLGLNALADGLRDALDPTLRA